MPTTCNLTRSQANKNVFKFNAKEQGWLYLDIQSPTRTAPFLLLMFLLSVYSLLFMSKQLRFKAAQRLLIGNQINLYKDMFINMRQFLAVLWTLGLLLHFYLLHEFFLLDYETILSNLKLYKLFFRKHNLSKNDNFVTML